MIFGNRSKNDEPIYCYQSRRDFLIAAIANGSGWPNRASTPDDDAKFARRVVELADLLLQAAEGKLKAPKDAPPNRPHHAPPGAAFHIDWSEGYY